MKVYNHSLDQYKVSVTAGLVISMMGINTTAAVSFRLEIVHLCLPSHHEHSIDFDSLSWPEAEAFTCIVMMIALIPHANFIWTLFPLLKIPIPLHT